MAGGKDEDVPADLIVAYAAEANSTRGARRARGGTCSIKTREDRGGASGSCQHSQDVVFFEEAVPAAKVMVFEEANHYELMDAASTAWTAMRVEIDRVLLGVAGTAGAIGSTEAKLVI